MISSKLHFHSGAKRCVPCCVTWSESRWVSHNFLVIVPLLALCFHKSSSWGCLQEPSADLHSSVQLGLPLTKKHIILSSTHKHFSWNTHTLERANRKRWINFERQGNVIWKLKCGVSWALHRPRVGRTLALSKVLMAKPKTLHGSRQVRCLGGKVAQDSRGRRKLTPVVSALHYNTLQEWRYFCAEAIRSRMENI